MIAGVAQAQTPKPAEPAKEAKPADATKPEVKKEEPMGKVEGFVITRPNGLNLGLTLVEGKFKLTFYDKKKKPTKVDVTRGLARWSNVHGPGDNRMVLNPDGANSLVGVQFVRPPYIFKLYLTLVKGDGDAAEVVETYVVDYHG